MKKKTEGHQPKEAPPSAGTQMTQLSPINLEDKRSVRTTFKLSKQGSEALEAISKDNNISFKETIDMLCQKFLTIDVISRMRKIDVKRELAVRKTYVISKGSLRTLNQISQKNGISRDSLLDWTLVMFEIMQTAVIGKIKKGHEEALKIVDQCRSALSAYEKKLKGVLTIPEDPILNRFGLVLVVLDNLQMAIEANLKENKGIDPEDMSQSC
jgi:hypothetical protein